MILYVASTYMYILLRRANYPSYFANGHTHLDIIYMIPYIPSLTHNFK